MANPQDGSRNRVEYVEKEPAMGKATVNSPRAWHVQYSMSPMREKAMRSDAGPPCARALPEATKRPVPTEYGVSDHVHIFNKTSPTSPAHSVF